MKIRALKKFEGIKDLERQVYPKEGDVWEVTKERAEFLKSHGVIEIVEEKPEKEIKKAIIEIDPMAKELFNTKLNEIEKHKRKKRAKK